MKFPRLLLVAVLLVSPGCDRARALASRIGGKALPAKNPAANPAPQFVDLADGEMERFSQQRGKLSIVEYHAAWNGQSRRLEPLLRDLARQHAGVLAVGRVDFDRCRDLATREGVKSVPDIRIYRDGSLVDRLVGLPDEEEFRSKIGGLVKNLPPPVAPGKDALAARPTTGPMPKDWMPSGMKRR